MQKSIVMALAILGITTSSLAQTNQSTKKTEEVVKEAESSDLNYTFIMEANRTNDNIAASKNNMDLDQEIKITKALSSTKSLRFDIRTGTTFLEDGKDVADVRWSYLQYADSKFTKIGESDISFALRLYAPAGISINRDGGITQLRGYFSNNWQHSKKFSSGFLLQPRLYVGDHKYYSGIVTPTGDRTYNSAYRLLGVYNMSYEANSIFQINQTLGIYNIWNARNQLNDNYYLWTDVTAKVNDNFSLTLAAEAVNSFENKGIQVYNKKDANTYYYLYGTTTW